MALTSKEGNAFPINEHEKVVSFMPLSVEFDGFSDFVFQIKSFAKTLLRTTRFASLVQYVRTPDKLNSSISCFDFVFSSVLNPFIRGGFNIRQIRQATKVKNPEEQMIALILCTTTE